MAHYTHDLDVIWHGAMENDPVEGGHTKGCLLPPRIQSVTAWAQLPEPPDWGLTKGELRAAVDRLNASLKCPLVFKREYR